MASTALTVWLTLISTWGFYVAVAGIGAVVAAVISAVSCVAFFYLVLIHPSSSPIVLKFCLLLSFFLDAELCGWLSVLKMRKSASVRFHLQEKEIQSR